MKPTAADFRDRCLVEFEAEAAKKFNLGVSQRGRHLSMEAAILSENVYEEIGQEIHDQFFYWKALGWQRRRVLELLYQALGDSHNWREYVTRAISLQETGKEGAP